LTPVSPDDGQVAIDEAQADPKPARAVAEYELLDNARIVLRFATAVAGTAIVVALLVWLLAFALFGSGDAKAGPQPQMRLQLVSSFTTRFSCCEPRVTNIRRAAQLLDDFVIPPHGRFSMNDALGKRTRARGFVPAPMISRGRMVNSVGGGISQVATTLYNAAFFAGLHLVAHTPHSFYIPRYPMGREATISWRGPELIFRNDWPAEAHMRLLVTPTSVTVKILSERLSRRVLSWTGKPHSFRRPTVRIIVDPRLPHGMRRVVQEAGPSGFTVAYGRSILREARLVRRERWVVHYSARDRIIEVGPSL
jgi:vancomycin resistance protein YoaR